jgi:hypothetical protein
MDSIKIGDNDQGSWNPPGGQISYQEVSFWRLNDGDFRAKIDTRYGSNQGYFQENGGGVERLDAGSLDECIELAVAHCDDVSGDNSGLPQACRIAAAEARTWLRHQPKPVAKTTKKVNLSKVSVEELQAELARRQSV